MSNYTDHDCGGCAFGCDSFRHAINADGTGERSAQRMAVRAFLAARAEIAGWVALDKVKIARIAELELSLAIEVSGTNALMEKNKEMGALIVKLAEALDVERARAAKLAEAGNLLLESLGEYIRQSMHFNPEWREGIDAMKAALADAKEST